MKAVTVDLVNLENVNATTVSQAIIKTLNKFNVNFNKVSAFVTDNASYMTKTMRNLQGILPHCVHLSCNAHILSLVGETWRQRFKKVDRLVAGFKAIFVHCSSRKQRYREYIAEQTHVDIDMVSLPPVPVVTRWNSWFNTVSHHDIYFEHYRGFIDAELEISASTNALSAQAATSDDGLLKLEVAFISNSTSAHVELLTWFESRHVQMHLAYNRIMYLLAGK